MRLLLLTFALLLIGRNALGCSSGSLPAAAPPFSQHRIPPAYALTRERIPMRDGACLDTFILAPRSAGKSVPLLVVRTPYDPTADWIHAGPEFERAGYIFVTQSVRGRYGSEGGFVQMRPHLTDKHARSDIDESTDAYDTIAWLIKNVPGNNGRAGLRGVSYNGFYAAAGMIDAHPALKAVSPQAPQADWFLGDDTHHNGAFLLASTFNFLMACDRSSAGLRTCDANFVAPGTDGLRFFQSLEPLSTVEDRYFHGDSPEWQAMMRHGNYDLFWQKRNILPRLQAVKPAVLAVSGWYDANNLYGTLHVYDSVRRSSPDSPARIVIGPWTHAQWSRDGGESVGPLRFGSATATDFIRNVELPFFESYLKGDGLPAMPAARMFDTGLNHWSWFDEWPPQSVRRVSWCLGARGSLQLPVPLENPPSATGACVHADIDEGYDEYTSDPAKPVPYEPHPGMDMDAEYMSRDQRFTANRRDVLSFRSEVLDEDVTIAGPVSPHLRVSSSATDSDWIVRVVDMRPDGFWQLIRGDVMRAKFRKSYTSPMPMLPYVATDVAFTMPDVYHTFRKGDRILVQIQSSWFPLIDLNPQQFEDIYTAQAADFRAAVQRVYYGGSHASWIEVDLLPAGKAASRAQQGP